MKTRTKSLQSQLTQTSSELTQATNDASNLRGVIDRQSAELVEVKGQNMMLAGSRAAVVESLLQERSELLGRMMRIDGRIKAFGVEIRPSAYTLVGLGRE